MKEVIKVYVIIFGVCVGLYVTVYAGAVLSWKIAEGRLKGISKLKAKIMEQKLKRAFKKGEQGQGNVVIFDGELREILKNARQV